MKRLAFVLTVLALAIVACGGGVAGGELADCPPNGAACSSGQECRMRVLSGCGNGTFDSTCTCWSKEWRCESPAPGGCFDGSAPPPIRETCGIAGAVTDGERCYPEDRGATCRRFGDGCILDDTCTCDGSKFTCTGGPNPSCDGGTSDGGADAAADAPTGG